ncbi:Vacuolar membrane-associated protein iml1 [Smittium mucronatum]|uniref:Vacuolar membrane-associated protein IML1 n=1 Tax=Smittium mucronatum TaxID=133383 RepID=A0A1R0GVZ2_9FUNG|nr:Vacuolar membrane-associated protein iml1 [Smittium mucronatum]
MPPNRLNRLRKDEYKLIPFPEIEAFINIPQKSTNSIFNRQNDMINKNALPVSVSQEVNNLQMEIPQGEIGTIKCNMPKGYYMNSNYDHKYNIEHSPILSAQYNNVTSDKVHLFTANFRGATAYDPCNPEVTREPPSSLSQRWSFNHPTTYSKLSSTPKWSTLCMPLFLPITTNFLPSDLSDFFNKYSYTLNVQESNNGIDKVVDNYPISNRSENMNLSTNNKKDIFQYDSNNLETNKTKYFQNKSSAALNSNLLLDELVYQRLSQGYQLVLAAQSAHKLEPGNIFPNFKNGASNNGHRSYLLASDESFPNPEITLVDPYLPHLTTNTIAQKPSMSQKDIYSPSKFDSSSLKKPINISDNRINGIPLTKFSSKPNIISEDFNYSGFEVPAVQLTKKNTISIGRPSSIFRRVLKAGIDGASKNSPKNGKNYNKVPLKKNAIADENSSIPKVSNRIDPIQLQDLITSGKDSVYHTTNSFKAPYSREFMREKTNTNVVSQKTDNILNFINQNTNDDLQQFSNQNSSSSVCLSNGRQIQFISISENSSTISSQAPVINVTRYEWVYPSSDLNLSYNYKIWPHYSNQGYMGSTSNFDCLSSLDFNWNKLDHLIVGNHYDINDGMRYYRTRYVLIPSETLPTDAVVNSKGFPELNQEELRILNFEKFLDQIFKSILPESKLEIIQKMEKNSVKKKGDTNPSYVSFASPIINKINKARFGNAVSGLPVNLHQKQEINTNFKPDNYESNIKKDETNKNILSLDNDAPSVLNLKKIKNHPKSHQIFKDFEIQKHNTDISNFQPQKFPTVSSSSNAHNNHSFPYKKQIQPMDSADLLYGKNRDHSHEFFDKSLNKPRLDKKDSIDNSEGTKNSSNTSAIPFNRKLDLDTESKTLIENISNLGSGDILTSELFQIGYTTLFPVAHLQWKLKMHIQGKMGTHSDEYVPFESPASRLLKTIFSFSMPNSSEYLSLNRNSPFSLLAFCLQHPQIGLCLSEHKWHSVHYLDVFTGTQLTNWIMFNFSDVNTRQEAVSLGNLFLRKNLIKHCARGLALLDGHYIYALTETAKSIKDIVDLIIGLPSSISGNINIKDKHQTDYSNIVESLDQISIDNKLSKEPESQIKSAHDKIVDGIVSPNHAFNNTINPDSYYGNRGSLKLENDIPEINLGTGDFIFNKNSPMDKYKAHSEDPSKPSQSSVRKLDLDQNIDHKNTQRSKLGSKALDFAHLPLYKKDAYKTPTTAKDTRNRSFVELKNDNTVLDCIEDVMPIDREDIKTVAPLHHFSQPIKGPMPDTDLCMVLNTSANSIFRGNEISNQSKMPLQSSEILNYFENTTNKRFSNISYRESKKNIISRDPLVVNQARTLELELDQQHRSSRLERALLHYDSVQNLSTSFHFSLNWLNCTPRLIYELIHNWTLYAKRCGMKLVEVPVSKNSSSDLSDPFHLPKTIKLIVLPPHPKFIFLKSKFPEVKRHNLSEDDLDLGGRISNFNLRRFFPNDRNLNLSLEYLKHSTKHAHSSNNVTKMNAKPIFNHITYFKFDRRYNDYKATVEPRTLNAVYDPDLKKFLRPKSNSIFEFLNLDTPIGFQDYKTSGVDYVKDIFFQKYLIEKKTSNINGILAQLLTGFPNFIFEREFLFAHGFVLDVEAEYSFPDESQVIRKYPFSRQPHKYPQFIHRSGMIFVQISDSGTFLWSTNYLYASHFSNTKTSIHSTTESIRSDANETHASPSINVQSSSGHYLQNNVTSNSNNSYKNVTTLNNETTYINNNFQHDEKINKITTRMPQKSSLNYKPLKPLNILQNKSKTNNVTQSVIRTHPVENFNSVSAFDSNFKLPESVMKLQLGVNTVFDFSSVYSENSQSFPNILAYSHSGPHSRNLSVSSASEVSSSSALDGLSRPLNNLTPRRFTVDKTNCKFKTHNKKKKFVVFDYRKVENRKSLLDHQYIKPSIIHISKEGSPILSGSKRLKKMVPKIKVSKCLKNKSGNNDKDSSCEPGHYKAVLTERGFSKPIKIVSKSKLRFFNSSAERMSPHSDSEILKTSIVSQDLNRVSQCKPSMSTGYQSEECCLSSRLDRINALQNNLDTDISPIQLNGSKTSANATFIPKKSTIYNAKHNDISAIEKISISSSRSVPRLIQHSKPPIKNQKNPINESNGNNSKKQYKLSQTVLNAANYLLQTFSHNEPPNPDSLLKEFQLLCTNENYLDYFYDYAMASYKTQLKSNKLHLTSSYQVVSDVPRLVNFSETPLVIDQLYFSSWDAFGLKKEF